MKDHHTLFKHNIFQKPDVDLGATKGRIPIRGWIKYYQLVWEYNVQDAVALPRVIHK